VSEFVYFTKYQKSLFQTLTNDEDVIRLLAYRISNTPHGRSDKLLIQIGLNTIFKCCIDIYLILSHKGM